MRTQGLSPAYTMTSTPSQRPVTTHASRLATPLHDHHHSASKMLFTLPVTRGASNCLAQNLPLVYAGLGPRGPKRAESVASRPAMSP